MLRPSPDAGLALTLVVYPFCFCLISIHWSQFPAAPLLLSQKLLNTPKQGVCVKSEVSVHPVGLILIYRSVSLLCLWFSIWQYTTLPPDLNRKPACSDFTTICLCQANVAEKELAEHCSGTCINHKTGTCNKLLVRVLCWRIPKLLFAFPLSKTRKVSRGWKVKQISIFRITALFTTSQLTPLNS